MSDEHFEYDVGLSFAGQQRDYVRDFANELTSRGVRVFFDDYEKAGLWGKDLYSHLSSAVVSQRPAANERDAVLTLLRYGCPADIPDNVHINTDLLHRATGKSVPKLKRLLGGLRSLGFECSIREATEADEAHLEGELLGESYLFELNWIDLSDLSDYPALLVARDGRPGNGKLLRGSTAPSSSLDSISHSLPARRTQSTPTATFSPRAPLVSFQIPPLHFPLRGIHGGLSTRPPITSIPIACAVGYFPAHVRRDSRGGHFHSTRCGQPPLARE